MAERQGFEPWKAVTPCWFSRPVHSTALPSLRRRDFDEVRVPAQGNVGLTVAIQVAHLRRELRIPGQCAYFDEDRLENVEGEEGVKKDTNHYCRGLRGHRRGF